jgi:uncharacterized protein (TIGR03437 family)
VSKKLFFALVTACLTAANLTAQTATVTAVPTSLTFTYQLGASTLPAAQKIAVTTTGGTLSYTTANADANALWLIVSPDSGNLPASLSVRVNPTGLGVGQYMTVGLTITVNTVATPVTIPVTLNITSPPSTLTVSPTTLTFAAPPSPVTSQTVQLSTSGAPMTFTATTGAVWLTVSPNVGVVLPGEIELLTITPDPTTLAPQSAPYSGKITITVSGVTPAPKAQTVTVSFTVNSSPPTITNIWPATLPLNAAAETITILGTNFYSGTVASIQGVTTPLTTTILSPTALLAVVPATQLTLPVTLNIVVTNPAPGGPSAPAALAVANIPTIAAVTNVASYATAMVSPGELITIFGLGIGPATPASLMTAQGFVTTTLSNVTLTIDTQPAPLIYVSENQVTAQVPYEVTQGAGKQVSLVNGTNPPATATVTVGMQAPGLFTSDGSGVNQAAALNYGATSMAYTLNTAANPAQVGDTVLLYLTGEGDYLTSITPRTGLVIPATLSPLPELSPLPTVMIGGMPATVAYAGPIIGSILGLLQINCVVPMGATTGKAVPVLVTINGSNTQTGVTLSIQ